METPTFNKIIAIIIGGLVIVSAYSLYQDTRQSKLIKEVKNAQQQNEEILTAIDDLTVEQRQDTKEHRLRNEQEHNVIECLIIANNQNVIITDDIVEQCRIASERITVPDVPPGGDAQSQGQQPRREGTTE